MSKLIIKADLISSKSYDELDIKKDHYIIVNDGIIENISDTLDKDYSIEDVIDYSGKLLIPAFTDLHIHASQYPQRGIGMDCLLIDWLNNYTFPQEANFNNNDYAKSIYAKLIYDLIKHGTFHLSLFTTIHYDACDILFKMLEESGLYAYTGLVNMDMNSPDYYIDNTKDSLEKTKRFIEEHNYSDRVKLILTPRFAPTCSKELMKGLGELAKEYNLGIQTHLVESIQEAKWAKELYPDCKSDGEIYEKYGLLQGNGPKIFAHVIFPSEVEERILKQYNAISVHCPDATSNIIAGIMPVSDLHNKGLKIALGSDVAGGHFIGIYRQIARSVQISKMKSFYEQDYQSIKLANAFYMATASSEDIFKKIGKLEVGYRFNALVLDNMLDIEYQKSLEDAIERFCYIGDDRNIIARYLDGKLIDPDEIYNRLLNI